MTEHDARDAQTPEEMANDIMHEACLPQSLIDKGVHQAMYEAIRDRIREAADAAHAGGKAEGAAEENEACAIKVALSGCSGCADLAAAIRAREGGDGDG